MRLPSLSSKQIIRALHQAGFNEAPDRGKGSHRAFFKQDMTGKTWLTVVPQGKDIPRGTIMSILDQAGLTREEFLKLL
ncbi:MAG: type II toxin-antitoxin system HicA family toxin [Elusimicrobiota bacterium]